MALTTSSPVPAIEKHPTAPSSRTLPPELQKELSKITDIGSLPEITTKIVTIVEDPKATAKDLHEVVKTDPALAAKILKVVNSAFYGLPSQIASLDRAILMLGMSAVKNISLAASLSRLFKGDAISDQFSAKDLWRHSIAVGVLARQLASAGKCAQADEAFVAGLVHDMGLMVAHQVFPDRVRAVADRCAGGSEPYCAVEIEMIGADHQTFGATLATRWKFPPGLRSTIAYHHEPFTLAPDFRRTATVVAVADTFCCQAQLGYWLTARTQQVTEEMLELICVPQHRAQEILNTLPDRLAEAEQIFAE